MNSKCAPDKIDWHILELLQRNARMSNTDIGKVVGLSQPAVTGRIARLEASGVIQGYGARINPKCLGKEITVFFRLKATHAQVPRCLKNFAEIPEILESYRITGEDCFILKATFDGMSRLEETIDRLGQFGMITTSVVIATYSSKPITETVADGRG